MAKVLIVDDNPEMRRLIRAMVGKLGEVVYECSDGAQALAAYQTHQPDFVLMDIEMKVLDGISATRQLLAAFPQARVIIVTNYDQPILHESARAAGACGYVLKENLAEIRRLLQSTEAQT
ncbi:MAG: response regulator transcription factor [Acidobacteria bacterium]|nr:response regulator transcription factor [Acidobacteriota bacterium]MBI3422719.1 response regulator transcription factor [Acidobacteriota bacterium]